MPEPVADVGLGSSLREAADRVAEQSAVLDQEGFAKAIGEVSARKAELQASVALCESRDALRAEVVRLQNLDRLGAAIGAAGTSAITNKVKELTRRYVTEEMSERFQEEARRLGLDNVALDDLGGKKGQLRQQPKLAGTTHQDADVTRVLSEGEQTALGLSGFFTEATIDPSKSALVFDDPVTSMDHVRRGRVAKRIVELAKDRQVAVFTHDLSFVVDLQKNASASAVNVHGRSIERRGRHPGACASDLPWKAKGFGPRKNHLETELVALRKEWDMLSTSEWEMKVALWAGELSELWERCVSTEIIGSLFDPDSSETRVRQLRLLAKFTEADNQDFQEGYGLTSVWAKRHDKALITNYVPPEPDALQAELDRVAAWQKRVKSYLLK